MKKLHGDRKKKRIVGSAATLLALGVLGFSGIGMPVVEAAPLPGTPVPPGIPGGTGTPPPIFSILPSVDGNQLSLVSIGPGVPEGGRASDYTVTVNGVSDVVKSIQDTSTSEALTLLHAVSNGDTVIVSYTGNDLINSSTDAPYSPFTYTAENTTPLQAPSLKIESTTSTSATLQWDPVSGATSYNVYENGSKIATGVTATHDTVSGLQPNATDTFTVTAVNANGESAQSSTVTVTTPNIGSIDLNSSSTSVEPGKSITVTGTVYDVYNAPVPNAIVNLSSPIGSWIGTHSTSESVTSDVYGAFSTTWTAPTSFSTSTTTVTASVYGSNVTPTTIPITLMSLYHAPVPPFINTAFLVEDAQVGVPYSKQILAMGGRHSYQWQVTSGSLPQGLTLSNSGLISGTPTGASGEYTFTVSVMDGNQLKATRQLTLKVDPANTPSISTTAVMVGTAGQSYDATLSATGGTSPYTWGVVTGTLPAGISLNAQTGELSGTPSESGVYQVTVQVTDANKQSAAQTLSLDVLQSNQRAIVWNGKVQNVPAIVRNDGGTQTIYLPIWYVMQLLKSMGIESTWNGHEWQMTSGSKVDLSNVQAGTGNTGIYLNGTLVQVANTQADVDPSTGKATTYMPIRYMEQILDRVGLKSSWNGTTWSVTQS